jgi:hypothetical protein
MQLGTAMKNPPLFLVALSSRAIAAEWKIENRDLTITNTVYTTSYVCPCTTYTPLPSSSTISFASNSVSVGSPILTSATGTPSTTVASSPVGSSSTAASSSVVIPSSSTSSAAGAGSTVFVSAATLPDYQTTVLQQHNIHRVNHTVPDLIWSPTMAQYAAQIASSCVYAHSKYILPIPFPFIPY